MKTNLVKLKDVCIFVGGSQPNKSEFIFEEKEGYVRLIQTRDYKTDEFLTFIPKSSTSKFCDVDDIMIGRYGPPIFQICRGLKGAYNVALMKAEPKNNIDKEYLYYFLKQKSIFNYVDKLSARTGGQTGVDLISLYEYPINLPENIDDQRKTVKVLTQIDKKIAINSEIISKLDSLLKLVYEYWFIQYEFPNSSGNPYKSNNGIMTEIDNISIPNGWKYTNIFDVCDLIGGGTPTKKNPEYWNGKIPFFTPTDSNNQIYCIDTIEKITNEGLLNSSTKLFEKNTIFITARGSVGRLVITAKPMAMNQSCYALKPKANVGIGYLYLLSKQLIEQLKVKATGSVFNSIVTQDIEFSKLIIPDIDTIKKFSIHISSIIEKIELISLENFKLEELREWLLPMLMNGQISIRDAEKHIAKNFEQNE